CAPAHTCACLLPFALRSSFVRQPPDAPPVFGLRYPVHSCMVCQFSDHSCEFRVPCRIYGFHVSDRYYRPIRPPDNIHVVLYTFQPSPATGCLRGRDPTTAHPEKHIHLRG